MRRTNTRFWLVLAALYAIASLLYLSRRLSGGDAAGHDTPRQPPPAAAVQSVPVSSVESNGCVRIYALPMQGEGRSVPSTIKLRLSSPLPIRRATVQVSATVDHHGTYSHDYVSVTIGPDGLGVTLPLRRSATYWHADNHDGVWSDWNTAAMRRLVVKVFLVDPRAGKHISVRYTVAGTESTPPGLLWEQPLQSQIPLGRRFETAFDVVGWSGNPFRAGDIDLRLEVTPPDGKARETRAFLYQNYSAEVSVEGEVIRPRGAKHWRARFRPSQLGLHRYRLVGRTEGRPVTLREGNFTVTAGTAPAYVEVSKTSPFFFERAGRFFYPNGWCILCPVDRPHGEEYVPYLPTQNSVTMMKRMLDDLAAAGGNCTRFWLTDWWTGLEWNEHSDQFSGLGRYNLKNAWIIDSVLDHCEKRNIVVILETLNHLRTRPRDRRYGGSWDLNPLNVDNGGFVQSFTRFWIDRHVIPSEQDRLRYILARYADSPAVHSWNYISEADLAGQFNWWGSVELRIHTLLQFIRENDIYGHLTSCHVADVELANKLAQRPSASFMHSNAYASRSGRGILAEEQVDAVRAFSHMCEHTQKPCLITEYGGRWLVEPAERRERDVVAGMWAGMASRLSGAPLSWWWNHNYGEDIGEYWRIAARFMVPEDLVREARPEHGGWINRTVGISAEGGDARALMVGNSSHRFLYVYNFETVGRTRHVPTLCKAPRISVGDMKNGAYVAEVWSTRSAVAPTQVAFTVENGRGSFVLPDFTHDWAVKILAGDKSAPEADLALKPIPTVERVQEARVAAPISWELTPLLPIHDRRAADRAVCETWIALPEGSRGRQPQVTGRDGAAVPFSWSSLGNGTGWHIRIPASSSGPFSINASELAPVAPAEDDAAGHGLTLTVVPAGGATFARDEAALVERFEGSADGVVELSAARIDDVENPAGDNDNYLSRYTGPLVVPIGGLLSFAVNSDDASFLRVDGTTAATWMGRHDMEVQNGPMVNLWHHRGDVKLPAGVHWIEYYHQESVGAQLARAGWERPELGETEWEWAVYAASKEDSASRWETIQNVFLDGSLPCRLDVLRDGNVELSTIPARALELRRPRTTFPAILVRTPKNEPWQHSAFRRPGPHAVEGLTSPCPVWVPALHPRAFSIEEPTPSSDRTELLTLAYDLPLAVELRVDGESLGTRFHNPGKRVAWPLPRLGRPVSAELLFMGLPLISVVVQTAADDQLPATQLPAREGPRPTILVPSASPQPGLLQIGRAPSGIDFGQPPQAARWTAFDMWDTDLTFTTANLTGAAPTEVTVLLPLDRAPAVRGFTPREYADLLERRVREIAGTGAMPMLVIPGNIDLENPQLREYALAMVGVRDRTGTPWLDLRTGTSR